MKFFRRRKSEEPGRLRLPLSAWLSYMLVATLLFSGVSFSKFAATAAMNDSVTVAGFALSGNEVTTANTITLDKTSGQTTADYKFQVKNVNSSNKVSDVTMSYTIKVVLPKALPTGVTVSCNMTSPYSRACTVTQSGTTYTFTAPVNLPAGTSTTHAYTLSFTGGTNLVTSDTLNGISVSVSAVQVD